MLSPPRPHSRRLSLLALSILVATAPAAARRHDEQIWGQINTHVPIAKNFRVTLEQIARAGQDTDGVYQTELGALFGYRVAKGIELGFGYRRVGLHNGRAAPAEDRLRQQIVANFGQFATRLRVDERFHASGGEIGFRIRPQIRFNQPVGRKGVALFVSHESFILPNSTRWGQQRGYDRMRNVAGVAVPLTRFVNADIGYLNQYRPSARGRESQMEHALTVQLTIDLEDL